MRVEVPGGRVDGVVHAHRGDARLGEEVPLGVSQAVPVSVLVVLALVGVPRVGGAGAPRRGGEDLVPDAGADPGGVAYAVEVEQPDGAAGAVRGGAFAQQHHLLALPHPQACAGPVAGLQDAVDTEVLVEGVGGERFVAERVGQQHDHRADRRRRRLHGLRGGGARAAGCGRVRRAGARAGCQLGDAAAEGGQLGAGAGSGAVRGVLGAGGGVGHGRYLFLCGRVWARGSDRSTDCVDRLGGGAVVVDPLGSRIEKVIRCADRGGAGWSAGFAEPRVVRVACWVRGPGGGWCDRGGRRAVRAPTGPGRAGG